MVLAFVPMGYVPVSYGASRLFQERMNLSLAKGGVLYKVSQEGRGFLQGQFRRKFGELLQIVRIRRL